MYSISLNHTYPAKQSKVQNIILFCSPKLSLAWTEEHLHTEVLGTVPGDMTFKFSLQIKLSFLYLVRKCNLLPLKVSCGIESVWPLKIWDTFHANQRNKISVGELNIYQHNRSEFVWDELDFGPRKHCNWRYICCSDKNLVHMDWLTWLAPWNRYSNGKDANKRTSVSTLIGICILICTKVVDVQI